MLRGTGTNLAIVVTLPNTWLCLPLSLSVNQSIIQPLQTKLIIGWITLKFCEDVYGFKKINPNDFDNL